MHRLGLCFWVQNFVISIFFGVFRKNEYFWGYEDFVDIFGGSSQNWTIFRGHFRIYAFYGIFLRSRYRMRDIFWGCSNFKYFFGVLEILDIFWGVNSRCWARAYV